MKFTVVTVSFNSGTKLTETIKNVLKQDFEDFEVLIKDGGSKDDSLTFLKEFLKSSGYEETEGVYRKGNAGCSLRLISEKDSGIYDAMNIAVKLAKGEYISFMNCGDYYASDDVLTKTAAVTEETGNKEIYYGDAYFRKVGKLRGCVLSKGRKRNSYAEGNYSFHLLQTYPESSVLFLQAGIVETKAVKSQV